MVAQAIMCAASSHSQTGILKFSLVIQLCRWWGGDVIKAHIDCACNLHAFSAAPSLVRQQVPRPVQQPHSVASPGFQGGHKIRAEKIPKIANHQQKSDKFLVIYLLDLFKLWNSSLHRSLSTRVVSPQVALIIIEILKVIELPSPHWSCGLSSVVFFQEDLNLMFLNVYDEDTYISYISWYEATVRGEFPWMVALLQSGAFLCGGTLIRFSAISWNYNIKIDF